VSRVGFHGLVAIARFSILLIIHILDVDPNEPILHPPPP
jgi:hypothetical protein